MSDDDSLKVALTPSMEAYILHWGEMGPQWGVNRTVAQIHALLWIWSEALDADTIAATLGVARSNVSNSLRELRDWGLVKPANALGRRKELFTADKDPWEVFLQVLRERRKREIEPTLKALRGFVAMAEKEKSPEAVGAKKRMLELSELMEQLCAIHDTASALPPTLLRKALKGGKFLSIFKS